MDNLIIIKLIKLFNKSKFYSINKLETLLKINSFYIEKYIKFIKSLGINIIRINNNVYYLNSSLKLLNKNIIKKKLQNVKLKVLMITDSTNQYLINHANSLSSGDVCVAEYQSLGRGRFGKKWISTFGENLCYSIYWKFEKEKLQLNNFSLMISIIIVNLLQNLGISGVQIKWPNDIYFHNRKLAGVLVETISRSNMITHVIIGIGINLFMKLSSINLIDQKWINLQEANIPINRDKLVIDFTSTLCRELRKFECNEFYFPFNKYSSFLDFFLNKNLKLFNNRDIS